MIPEKKIAQTEAKWFWVVNGVLLTMITVMVVTTAASNLHPPSSAETIDPTQVYGSAEFSESNLGTSIVGGKAVIRMIAQQYSFVPSCITVPSDTDVDFRITSADVVHGFIIAETNVNTMVVPGYISDVRTRFDRPGSYTMPCHEFCGLGHAGMAATVRVVPRAEFPRLGQTERMRCARQ